ncbi:hypothetical protein ACG10_12915 [Azotobacter chroococcum]|nr:hypothetical protein ACG10_12915 [Azotobacter chroococcum]
MGTDPLHCQALADPVEEVLGHPAERAAPDETQQPLPRVGAQQTIATRRLGSGILRIRRQPLQAQGRPLAPGIQGRAREAAPQTSS